MLLERQAGKPQTWYRRCLGAVLFAFSMPLFLYLHGLPYALTRQVRRGLVLTAFEALGAALLGGALTLSNLAAYASPSRAVSWIWPSFFVVGSAILLVTFVAGVGPVWLDAFILRRRLESLERIDTVEAALSSNPQVPALLLAAPPTERDRSRNARRMIRRFGRQMSDGLRRLWQHADSATRRRIVLILARHKYEESSAFLRTAEASLDWRTRLRYRWEGVVFRVELWRGQPFVMAVALALSAGQRSPSTRQSEGER